MATPWTAEALKWLHPMRTSRYLLSEAFNPWMRGIAMLAAAVVRNRHPLAKDQPLIERERKLAGDITDVLAAVRKARDALYEQAFNVLFETAAVCAPKNE
jgi:hypothetical protein